MAGNFKGTETADIVGAESGDSGDQVRRYIRLTKMMNENGKIRDRDTFELDDAKRRVEAFLDKNLYLTENDLYFLRSFRLGRYKPENLFSDERVLERIADHPRIISMQWTSIWTMPTGKIPLR